MDVALVNDGAYRGPFPGQQTKFVQATQREVFFGGAGGGGKSVNGMGKFLQQLAVESKRYERGEIEHSKAWGIYLRKTMPDLKQAIDKSYQIFQDFDPDAYYNINDHVWTFPNCADAHFEFGHMENENTKYKYKSREFTYCVARGTRVLMADGSLWPVEKIRPDDIVATLAGPRRVLRHWSAGIKPCVSAVVSDASGTIVGGQEHPLDHPLLTIAEEQPLLFGERIQSERPSRREYGSWRSYESLLSDHPERAPSSALSASAGSGSATCYDLRQDGVPLPGLIGPVVLLARSLRRGQAPGAHAPFHGNGDPCETSSPGDCRGEHGSNGGRLPSQRDIGRSSSLQPDDVGTRSRDSSRPDGPEPSPRHIQTWRDTWRHPYTGEERAVCDDVTSGTVRLTPVGDRETFDLTIEDANHYITECGLINRNCFMDELTEHSETVYDYMDTRIRTTDAVLEPMLQMCSGSNPDGPGLLWVRKRFIEGKEPEVIYRKETRLRDGRILYYDSIFIPASLKDNPILYESGQYEASLLNKRPEVRRAILEGDWWINPGAFLANCWDRSVHVVPNHDVPRGCRVYRSCDPGIGAPTSVTWYYEDRNGGFTGIHNLYLRNHDAAMMAQRIKEVEEFYGWWDEEGNRSTLDGWMDEDAFNRNLVGGPSYARIHQECGIRWRKGRKDRSSRFNGASEIVRRLQARVKDIDGTTKPLLRWMERCKAPIETLPVLQTDPNDPNDVDTKGEDHCWDDLMYLCLARTVRDHGSKDDDDDDLIDLDEYRDRYKGGSRALGVIPGGW